MSTERWLEWIKARKTIVGLTNAQIADRELLSKPTVDRILSGHITDLRLSTLKGITKAVIDGSWGEFPCHNSETIQAMARLSVEEIKEFESLKAQKETFNETIKEVKAHSEKSIAFLAKQLEDAKATIRAKERRITILSVVVGLLAVGLIASLII